ncbi:hypothetical protein D3C73_1526820 [compost metagenome]
MPVGDGCQFRSLDLGGEAGDGIVAGMHLHQQRGTRADGVGEVGRMGTVGGAHFQQPRTGAAHHIGNTERTTDLHQFAA